VIDRRGQLTAAEGAEPERRRVADGARATRLDLPPGLLYVLLAPVMVTPGGLDPGQPRQAVPDQAGLADLPGPLQRLRGVRIGRCPPPGPPAQFAGQPERQRRDGRRAHAPGAVQHRAQVVAGLLVAFGPDLILGQEGGAWELGRQVRRRQQGLRLAPVGFGAVELAGHQESPGDHGDDGQRVGGAGVVGVVGVVPQLVGLLRDLPHQVGPPGHRRGHGGLGQQRGGPGAADGTDRRRGPHQAVEGRQRVTRPRPGPAEGLLGFRGEDRALPLGQRLLGPGRRRPRVAREVRIGGGAQQVPGPQGVIGGQLRRPPPGPGGRAVPAVLPRLPGRVREGPGDGLIGTGGRGGQVPGLLMAAGDPGQRAARGRSHPQRRPFHYDRAQQRVPEPDLAVRGAHQTAALRRGEVR